MATVPSLNVGVVAEKTEENQQTTPREDSARTPREDSSRTPREDSSRTPRLRRKGSFRAFADALKSEKEHPKVWQLMSSYLSPEPTDVEQFIVNHLEYTLARSRFNFDDFATYQATALSLRDRMIEFWNDTQQFFTKREVKRVYYLSIEFLMGRSMQNAITNLDIQNEYTAALKHLGYKLEALYDQEHDAALGNGGLGRLAACFLDSLATMNLPAWGYGIRYQYGMLHQDIRNGYQVEKPDFWLRKGNPWEICRTDVTYPVRFYGTVSVVHDVLGHDKFVWEGGEIVKAIAYDTPIPGYKTHNTLNLRLWSAMPDTEFDLKSFNEEDYYGAVKARQQSEHITSVLYPNDKTAKGKELRLKQQYFFCCASLRDILRRFKKTNKPLIAFPSMVAMQLNDTHPVIAIPELMRILLDEEYLGWVPAWDIVTATFAYTNHTVLPEALEKWSVDLLGSLLPRHLQIIYEINRRFLQEVADHFPGDTERLNELSIIDDGHPKQIRMAHLAIVASHSVNGVAYIHTEIVKNVVFNKFYEHYPNKFNNKTNGVTPRRWILCANPHLSRLLTETLGGDEWVTDLPLIAGIKKYADDPIFQERFYQAKQFNKERLRKLILKVTAGELDVDVNALFDIQIKRIHEYKRQLLNILGVISRYNDIKHMSSQQKKEVVPRVCVIAGKAAPGYYAAKIIIKLINSVAEVVNHDPMIGNLLKVIFIPNYNVSLAEVIIPASDISQHISTAGTEASGTSNMKFAMNGGLILGTLDGANVEICEEAGIENEFIFGARANEVPELRKQGPQVLDERFYHALVSISQEVFGPYETYRSVLEPLWKGNDYYLLAHDFRSFLQAQADIDCVFKDRTAWIKRCILTTGSMGKFSSDCTIKNYANEIWGVEPCKLPDDVDEVFHK